MASSFLVPGYHPTRPFYGPDFDVLRDVFIERGDTLRGVSDTWTDHGIRTYGKLAAQQMAEISPNGILIGHSLGAIASLTTVEHAEVRRLILCSPSALFAEDIARGVDEETEAFIGTDRVRELSTVSAADATETVNQLGIPTVVMFGTHERTLHPNVVIRSQWLADAIDGAELIEVPDAAHSIRQLPYAEAVADVVASMGAA